MDRTDEREASSRDEPPAVSEEQERARVDRDHQFRALVDAVEEYAIFRLDPEGTVMSWNTGAERIKGYPAEDILGEHFSTFYTAEDREAGVPDQNLAAAADHGSTEDEGWQVRADGSRFWANVTITAIRDDDGTLQGYAKVTRDMTQQRAYERQLKEQAEQLEQQRNNLEQELGDILERVDDAFYALDDEFRFTYVNDTAEEYLGKSAGDLLGRKIWEVLDVDEDDPIIERYEMALAAQEPASFERYSGLMKMWAVVKVYPSATGLSVYFRDISERKAREQELKRYEMAVERVWDGITILDSDNRFVLVNEAFCELTGYDREEVVGEHATLILEETTYEQAGKLHDEVVEGDRDTATLEYDLLTANGGTVPVEARFGPVQYADGTVGGAGVIRDITERKERERELEEQRERYQRLTEAAPVPIATYDPHGLLTYVNQAGIDLMGVTEADELLGESAIEFVHPEDRAAAAKRMQQVIEERDGVPPKETRVVTPDGDVKHTVITSVPITQDGVPTAQIVLTDITERKEREHELERALDLLERTERVADVGGWEIDVDTREVFWTDHIFELLEVSSDEEPPLEKALDMYHEEDQPIIQEAVEEALHAGEPFDVEVRIRTAPGEIRWLRVQGVPETVDERVVLLRGAAQDITERKQREQRLEELIDRLEESNQRLEQFAHAASHDLQEPLRMVSSYLQLIEQRYSDALDKDGEEFLDFAVDGADRMREMIEGLLQYSRIDSQGDPMGPVKLDEVLKAVREDLQLKIDENDAHITVDELPRVRGDRGQLRQLFQNLIDNAIEYSGDEPPRVHISAERNPTSTAEWEITVRDKGIGIDAKETDQIFEVFQRLHSRDEHAGVGIGLALCQRIVERHGGHIWVDSEPGEGSTFSFMLPAASKHAT